MSRSSLSSLIVCLAGSMALAAQDRQPIFVPASAPITVGPMAGLPETADFNGDGHLDAVVACGPCCGSEPSIEAGHVQVLLGDGKGGLRLAGPRMKIGETALRVAVGDVDGDGSVDIACIQHSSYEASVLLGDGKGGFSEPRKFSLYNGQQAHVHSVVLADVNEDGHPDLIASLIEDHAIAVHLGDGKGDFRPALAQPFFAHLHPYEQLNVVDLNRDGHVDIACTDLRGNGITVLLGSGTGMFATSKGFRMAVHTPIHDTERPLAMALGDFTGDGYVDAIATIDDFPQVVLMTNDGSGEFQQAGKPLRTALPTQSGIRVADFNGDGKLDFAAGGISLSLGIGKGVFGESVKIESGGRLPYIAVGDFDEDGKPDLVASSYEDGTVTVLLNRIR